VTLILAMPTKGPLVFAPDRRMTLPKGKYDDSVNKLVMIGGIAVGSAYGPVRLQGEGSDVVRFDVYDIMRKFFANGVYNPQRLAEFEQHIAAQFADYRQNYRGGKIFKNTFRVIIYTWTNGEFRFNHRVFWTGQDGKLNPTGTNTKCSHGGIFADGDDAIITELMSGHKPAFDDLRNDKDIKRFVINRQQQAINTVEPEDAIAFCKRLIAICNEYYPLIDDEKNPISKECNLALLKRDGGCEVLI
jgi:hypothetical protein